MTHYSRRLAHKRRSPLHAELVYLLVVLVAAVATAWWAGHAIGVNLSVIEVLASTLGVGEQVSTPHQVGYVAVAAQDGNGQSTAPFCQPGETPAFANGLAELKRQVGNVMGAPIECEHAASVGGDTVQQTSTGLAAYNRRTNTATFTDGWRHWGLTPSGVVNWEGTASDPPTATASDPEPAPQ